MKLPHNNLIWPLSVILLSLMIIGMLLLHPATPTAAPLFQGCDPGSPYYPSCNTATSTRTATARTGTATVTATSDGTSSTATPQANTSSTPTLTRTRTPTPSEEVEEDLDASTSTPDASVDQPTSSPTSTLTPVSDVLTCIPGVPLRIEGQTTPRTALLLYFDGRPVGGATSNVQGLYSIQLVVGDEKSGDYLLEVQVRGTRDPVDERICRVPGVSSTPTPTEIGAP